MNAPLAEVLLVGAATVAWGFRLLRRGVIAGHFDDPDLGDACSDIEARQEERDTE